MEPSVGLFLRREHALAAQSVSVTVRTRASYVHQMQAHHTGQAFAEADRVLRTDCSHVIVGVNISASIVEGESVEACLAEIGDARLQSGDSRIYDLQRRASAAVSFNRRYGLVADES